MKNQRVAGSKMIVDVVGDLFEAPSHHSLAHCISQDSKMSKGIAKTFVSKFPILNSLKKLTVFLGMAVPARVSGKFLYNLVTKRYFWSKPTLSNLKSSLQSLHLHAKHNGVKEISIPRLGGGLDCLDFDKDVRPLLLDEFSRSTIIVYIHSLSVGLLETKRYIP